MKQAICLTYFLWSLFLKNTPRICGGCAIPFRVLGQSSSTHRKNNKKNFKDIWDDFDNTGKNGFRISNNEFRNEKVDTGFFTPNKSKLSKFYIKKKSLVRPHRQPHAVFELKIRDSQFFLQFQHTLILKWPINSNAHYIVNWANNS